MRIAFLLETLVVAALALVGHAQDDDCKQGLINNLVFGEGTFVGQQYGDSNKELYCETRWKQGLVVNGIEVWASKDNVQAFRLRYTDGTWSKQYGNPKPDDWSHEQVLWDSGDKIESIKIQPNKKRDSPGKMEWKIKGKEPVTLGSKKTWGDQIDAELFSGIFLGVWGKGDADYLSSMMLLFLKTDVEAAEISEMKFDQTIEEMNAKQEGIEDIFMSRIVIENTNKFGDNKTYSFINTGQRDKKMSAQQSTTHTISAGTELTVSGKAGVPLLAEAEVSASVSAGYQLAHMETKGTEQTSIFKMEWNESGELKPGFAAVCQAIAYKGTYSSGYTSTVKSFLRDGSSFSYTQRGHFDSVGYMEGKSNCEITTLDKVPPGIEKKEADPKKPKVARQFTG
ncbi:unnamed protein product [Periconia digitata]|uniref:Uncharacterized protein n=1 Tax=Periconia digitata TaxID=1303443 RepID=A0A9W4XQU8_9PLEO|nr:unnamed protein product [Periconia digitata]